MSKHPLLVEIEKLPLKEQRQILEELNRTFADQPDSTAPSEAEFERMLLAKGIITEIPAGVDQDEEDFELIVVEGKPLSDTIIEERRQVAVYF